MRHGMARFVVALGLILAATVPARASGVIWNTWLKSPDGGLTGGPYQFNGTYVGPYMLGAETINTSPVKTINKFAAGCTNDSITIRTGSSTSNNWQSIAFNLDAEVFQPSKSVFLSGWTSSLGGLNTTTVKQAAWLYEEWYQLNLPTDSAAVGAIHEAIWKLTDAGYSGDQANSTTNMYDSDWWVSEVQAAYASGTDTFFTAAAGSLQGWDAYQLLMPYDPATGTLVDLYSDPVPPNSQPFLTGRVTLREEGDPITPEPGSMALLLVGMGLFGLQRRRSRSVVS